MSLHSGRHIPTLQNLHGPDVWGFIFSFFWGSWVLLVCVCPSPLHMPFILYPFPRIHPHTDFLAFYFLGGWLEMFCLTVINSDTPFCNNFLFLSGLVKCFIFIFLNGSVCDLIWSPKESCLLPAPNFSALPPSVLLSAFLSRLHINLK